METKNEIQPLLEWNDEKETKITWDRTRFVNYNGGQEIPMNTFGCSSCGENYHFQETKHSFCPFCGTKYKYFADVSI